MISSSKGGAAHEDCTETLTGGLLAVANATAANKLRKRMVEPQRCSSIQMSRTRMLERGGSSGENT